MRCIYRKVRNCLIVVHAFQKNHEDLPVFSENRIRNSNNPNEGVNKCEVANVPELDVKRNRPI